MSTTNVRSMTIDELQTERTKLMADMGDYVRRGAHSQFFRDIWERIEAIDHEVWARQDKAEAQARQ